MKLPNVENRSHRDIKEVDVLHLPDKSILFHPLNIEHKYDKESNTVTVKISREVETFKSIENEQI